MRDKLRLILTPATVALAACLGAVAPQQHGAVARAAGPPGDPRGTPIVEVTGRTRTPVEPGTFLALWQPRHAGTVLERFSLADGLPVGQLAQVAEGAGQPHAGGESVWLTVSNGPRYLGRVAGGDPQANTCSATVERLDLRDGTTVNVLSFPHSVKVDSAVPSPSDQQLVMLSGICNRAYFNQHLVVDDLRSGRSWAIGVDAAPCHSISAPSWNAAGTQLVFAYAPADRSQSLPETPRPDLGGGVCTQPRAGNVAIVPAEHASHLSRARLIAPPHGCSYDAAVFDREGIAAALGCEKGSAPGFEGLGDYMGDAYIVQIDRRGHVARRRPLLSEPNPITLSPSPAGGPVLVTEKQGENNRPWWDSIWTFDGHKLRLVGHYRESVTATAE